jgi:glutamate 5-kinase
MAKGAVTSYGTGGMSTKIAAARIATDSGADMAILDSSDLELIERLMDGEDVGTLFIANNDEEFDTVDFIVSKGYLK